MSIPIIRTRDGLVVEVGSTWNTGDTVDLEGNLVENGKPVELIAADIPKTGNHGKATVKIGNAIIRGPMTIRDNHPSFPGQRIAFLDV
jgi:hypothetical protein